MTTCGVTPGWEPLSYIMVWMKKKLVKSGRDQRLVHEVEEWKVKGQSLAGVSHEVLSKCDWDGVVVLCVAAGLQLAAWGQIGCKSVQRQREPLELIWKAQTFGT